MTGVELIAAERKRQVEEEGWTAEHDAQHTDRELAMAAACYAIPAEEREQTIKGPSATLVIDLSVLLWPFERKWWKPKDRIRNLVKAGALIAAEIDRLQSS